jgi:hypothetical protein
MIECEKAGLYVSGRNDDQAIHVFSDKKSLLGSKILNNLID